MNQFDSEPSQSIATPAIFMFVVLLAAALLACVVTTGCSKPQPTPRDRIEKTVIEKVEKIEKVEQPHRR